MDNCGVQLVGGPCGQHGPYTFYKAFKYAKNGVKRIVTLSEFFFVKLWIDSDLLCIGELQLLWVDKNSEQVLASLRLYFLPENTPEGRMDHGEDEVLAISEKVVLRVEDLITWITVDAEWTWGRLAKCELDVSEPKSEENKTFKVLTENSLDFSDIEKERKSLDSNKDITEGPSVLILSYARYCRYRAMMKRLEDVENEFLKYKIVNALGGFTVNSQTTRVLFCKETFDYPELEGHELLCNHLAPKLKGRPRGKRKKRSVSPGSESNESESSISNVFNNSSSLSSKQITSEPSCSGLHLDTATSLRRSTRSQENSESKEFFKKLCVFMKTNHTPIGRVPSLGYKEIDLHAFYIKVQKLGGYDSVTANRLWKSIFDEMSGHQNSTSAATVVRRHYERFLLPYERHVKGEEYKPLPISERRRLKSKAGSSTSDDADETSEGTSRSGNSTPVPQLIGAASPPITPTSSPESSNKESNNQIKVEGGTTSSLRSVRVKPERQKDKQSSSSDNKNDIQNNNNNNLPIIEVKNEIIDETNELKIDSEITDISDTNNTNNNNNIVAVKSETINLPPDKDAEPLTSAVAPVAQKSINPEKSPSPIEGKENVPIIKTGDDTPIIVQEAAATAATTSSDDDNTSEVIEVPYKSKSPEIVDLESDQYKSITANLNKPFIHEVKKRKLDILKEGGLEVTPVRSFVAPSITIKDYRPSVIQQATTVLSPPQQQMISSAKVNRNDIRTTMPPPSVVPTTKPSPRLHISIPQSINISQIQTPSPPTITTTAPSSINTIFANGYNNSPPKILQSNSIYSHSEQTVYGDPKDYIIMPPRPPMYYHPHEINKYSSGFNQRLLSSSSHGNDVLDLTMKSQQKKPVVEIMRIPPVAVAPPTRKSMTTVNNNINTKMIKHKSSSNHFMLPPASGTTTTTSSSSSSSTPLIDGRRLGSNLEITLVGTNNNNNNKMQQQPTTNSMISSNSNKHGYYQSSNHPNNNNNYRSHPNENNIFNNSNSSSARYSQKRSANDTHGSQKVPRLNENGRNYHHQHLSTIKDNHRTITVNNNNNTGSSSADMTHVPSSPGRYHHFYTNNNNSNSRKSSTDQMMKSSQITTTSTAATATPPAKNNLQYNHHPLASYTSYLSQFYDGTAGSSNINKGGASAAAAAAPYLPMLDPLYYLYSHHNASVQQHQQQQQQPLMPFPTSEQIKLYTDLMAHSSRLNFPFQILHDGNTNNSGNSNSSNGNNNPSIVNSNHHFNKKP